MALFIVGLALGPAGTACAQVPNLHGTPISVPQDCRTGTCAQNQATIGNLASALTARQAAAALAGYWAANDHVSYLIFSDGDAVARLVEVVGGQVIRDRHATFTEQAPDMVKPGHLVFNLALQTTGLDNEAPEQMSIEFYTGMHEADLTVSPNRRVRLWFVRKTDQLDVDALEHPRVAASSQGPINASPEPGKRPFAPDICPEARAWQASLSYPKAAMRQAVYEGSVTLWFAVRPDGSTSEYRVESFTDDRFVGASLEGLARLRCTGVEPGQLLSQTLDYKVE